MRIVVITSTIGRPELRRCIGSVEAQTYGVDHYVFVNGSRFHDAARATITAYPDVRAFYLPEETGDYGMGGSMADVFAAAPFLTRADWVFYLDDDNWYEPNHVESVMTLAREHDLKWAYSLRRFVSKDGQAICDDDWSSLGHSACNGVGPQFLVDNSCYAVSRRLAQKMALAWTATPFFADRAYFLALKESGERAGCTGLSTVNYRIGTGTAKFTAEQLLASHASARTQYPEGFPWRKPQVFTPSTQ